MENQDRFVFPAVFGYEPDHEISVVFPDLDVATSGTDDADALASARELLGCVLYGLEQDGEDIPAPSGIMDISVEPNERTVLVDVYMPAIRLAESNKSVEPKYTGELSNGKEAKIRPVPHENQDRRGPGRKRHI